MSSNPNASKELQGLCYCTLVCFINLPIVLKKWSIYQLKIDVSHLRLANRRLESCVISVLNYRPFSKRFAAFGLCLKLSLLVKMDECIHGEDSIHRDRQREKQNRSANAFVVSKMERIVVFYSRLFY